MSPETWSLSLAKYLELSFYGERFTMRDSGCQHSLHHDHVRYFGQGEQLVCFDYEPITLLELSMPSVHSLIAINADTPPVRSQY